MRAISFLFLLLVAGCAAPHQFAAPDATWKTRVGQAKYATGTTTVIGDVTVISKGAACVFEFRKAGGVTLLTMRSDGAVTRYEGPFARMGWQGAVDEMPPDHLKIWRLAHTAFTEIGRGVPQRATEDFGWQGKFTGGELTALHLFNSKLGQTVDFQFSR